MLILGKTGTRMYLRKESECQQPIALFILSGFPIICAVVAAPMRKLCDSFCLEVLCLKCNIFRLTVVCPDIRIYVMCHPETAANLDRFLNVKLFPQFSRMQNMLIET